MRWPIVSERVLRMCDGHVDWHSNSRAHCVFPSINTGPLDGFLFYSTSVHPHLHEQSSRSTSVAQQCLHWPIPSSTNPFTPTLLLAPSLDSRPADRIPLPPPLPPPLRPPPLLFLPLHHLPSLPAVHSAWRLLTPHCPIPLWCHRHRCLKHLQPNPHLHPSNIERTSRPKLRQDLTSTCTHPRTFCACLLPCLHRLQPPTTIFRLTTLTQALIQLPHLLYSPHTSRSQNYSSGLYGELLPRHLRTLWLPLLLHLPSMPAIFPPSL